MSRMGFNVTCILSSYPHATSLNTIMKEYLSTVMVTSHWSKTQRRAATDSAAYKAFSPYSVQDEETRREMVLIGPFDDLGNPISNMLTMIDPTSAVRQGLIRAIEHVVPLDDSDAAASLGTFVSTATGLRYNTYRDPWLMFVNATALRILSLAAPALTPQRLWTMQMKSYSVRGMPGVDYGPISHGGAFLQLHRVDDDCRLDEWVADFLLKSVEPTEHDKHLLMMDAGNMWVFVRPDDFPVVHAFALMRASSLPLLACAYPVPPPSATDDSTILTYQPPTLEALPLDVLLLITSHLSLPSMVKLCSASHTLLNVLFPFLDSLARRCMAQSEPWYLPPHGKERTSFHEQYKIARGPDTRDDDIAAFPWFWYARACRCSPSMRNRKRIWGIAEQLQGVARKMGILEI